MVVYIERWLKAPVGEVGQLVLRELLELWVRPAAAEQYHRQWAWPW
jgi:hypothetical protein